MPPPAPQCPTQSSGAINDDYFLSPSPKRTRFHPVGVSLDPVSLSQANDSPQQQRDLDHFTSNITSSTGSLDDGGFAIYNAFATVPSLSRKADVVQPLPRSKPAPIPSMDESNVRRLSVRSLLSEDNYELDSETQADNPVLENMTYGVDCGFPDFDLPKNNDSIALGGMISISQATHDLRRGGPSLEYAEASVAYGYDRYRTDETVQGDSYYRRPVTVAISSSLGTLPPKLHENPMNLLYFHHFLNHTARILVPHDCIENPFRDVLPYSECPIATNHALLDTKVLQWHSRMRICSISCLHTQPVIVHGS